MFVCVVGAVSLRWLRGLPCRPCLFIGSVVNACSRLPRAVQLNALLRSSTNLQTIFGGVFLLVDDAKIIGFILSCIVFILYL